MFNYKHKTAGTHNCLLKKMSNFQLTTLSLSFLAGNPVKCLTPCESFDTALTVVVCWNYLNTESNILAMNLMMHVSSWWFLTVVDVIVVVVVDICSCWAHRRVRSCYHCHRSPIPLSTQSLTLQEPPLSLSL